MAAEDKALGVVIGIWVLAVLLNLALFGVVIWAIIALVNHFTG